MVNAANAVVRNNVCPIDELIARISCPPHYRRMSPNVLPAQHFTYQRGSAAPHVLAIEWEVGFVALKRRVAVIAIERSAPIDDSVLRGEKETRHGHAPGEPAPTPPDGRHGIILHDGR
jgi:hypothetical protein